MRTGKVGAIALHQVPVPSDAGYAVALHEIGHLVSPGQAGPVESDALALKLRRARMLSDRYLGDELDAWFWARDHALCWTRAMAKQAHQSLRSYAPARRWQRLGVDASFTGTLQLESYFAECRRQLHRVTQPGIPERATPHLELE